MITSCPGCNARFRLGEERLQGRSSVRIRCPRCTHVFSVRVDGAGGDEPAPDTRAGALPRGGGFGRNEAVDRGVDAGAPPSPHANTAEARPRTLGAPNAALSSLPAGPNLPPAAQSAPGSDYAEDLTQAHGDIGSLATLAPPDGKANLSAMDALFAGTLDDVLGASRHQLTPGPLPIPEREPPRRPPNALELASEDAPKAPKPPTPDEPPETNGVESFEDFFQGSSFGDASPDRRDDIARRAARRHVSESLERPRPPGSGAAAAAPLADGGIDPVFEFREMFEELRETDREPPKPLTQVLQSIDANAPPASSSGAPGLLFASSLGADSNGEERAGRVENSRLLALAMESPEPERRTPPPTASPAEGDALIARAQSRLIRLDITGDAARRRAASGGGASVWMATLLVLLAGGFCYLAWIAGTNDGVIDLRRLPDLTRAALGGPPVAPRYTVVYDIRTGDALPATSATGLPISVSDVRASYHAREAGGLLLIEGETLVAEGVRARDITLRVGAGTSDDLDVVAGLPLDLEALLRRPDDEIGNLVEARYAQAAELVFEGPLRVPFSAAVLLDEPLDDAALADWVAHAHVQAWTQIDGEDTPLRVTAEGTRTVPTDALSPP